MENIIEAAINTIKSMFDDEPKDPLHVGEVMSCWIYFDFSIFSVGPSLFLSLAYFR